jgi:hypothetical protein
MIPPIELELWEQQVYEFGITLPVPPLPKPPDIGWGGVGLNLALTCPGQGAGYCERPEACTTKSILPLSVTVPGFSVSLPIPSINIPPISVRVVIPPKIIIPLQCPFYSGPPTPPA